jgi:NAD(P)-dependent dehydrogenase (short-subunit alcohol dehydrogenase family)
MSQSIDIENTLAGGAFESSWDHLPMHAPQTNTRLQGMVVLVHGGGSPGDGLTVGQAAAFAYGRAGAKVIVVDRNSRNAERTLERLESIGVECLALEADITDADSVMRATEEAVKGFGRIDVLHNNVGIPQMKPFTEFDESEWLTGMRVNCLGAATTVRSALPYLLANGSGVVTNVSSVAAIRHTGMNYAVYSASKAALNQLTVAVALEFAKNGLRANAILPGLLDTDMGRSLAKQEPHSGLTRAERSPLKFEGDPWDVANAAVFLASREARYINGHLLVVDGGLSVRC